MSWLEQKIRRYEHARWTTDDNRRVFPFEWGLEHIGGRRDEPDPRAFLNAWVDETLAHSDDWFAVTPADDYLLHPPENGASGGRVLTSTSQAITDTRRCLRWLEQQGYTRLGLVGTSIGSAVGSITMAHDRAVRAGAFLHVSTYFADVVRTGMTTMHVWEGLRSKVTEDELRRYWSPISPVPYMDKLRNTGQRMLMISGRYDPTFWYEFTEEMFQTLRQKGVQLETLTLPCGHYSLELAPFAFPAGLRLGLFLFEALA